MEAAFLLYGCPRTSTCQAHRGGEATRTGGWRPEPEAAGPWPRDRGTRDEFHSADTSWGRDSILEHPASHVRILNPEEMKVRLPLPRSCWVTFLNRAVPEGPPKATPRAGRGGEGDASA